MSTHERKMRKRAGVKFERTRKPAKPLSPAEFAEVERFGLHKPADDVQGMTWGMRFVAVAAIVAGVWLVGLLLVLLGLVVFQ